jgi:HlyD family secretion protein
VQNLCALTLARELLSQRFASMHSIKVQPAFLLPTDFYYYPIFWQKFALFFGLLTLCTACNSSKREITQTKLVNAAPVNAVVALGTLQPEGEIIKLSSPNAQDSRVDRILVKEGDFVRVNQVVAVLQGIDTRQAELQDARADVRLRNAELLKVRQGEAKKSQIEAQKSVITRLEAQLITQTAQTKASIANAEATLNNARLTYQRRVSLQKQGAIKLEDLDIAQRDLATSEATLNERQADLDRVLKTLSAEIAQEKSKLAELTEIRPIDVEIAQAQLEKARIAVKERKARLADAEVRAPVAGQILKINSRVGEQVSTTQGIVELAKTDSMFAVAEISETDIGKVRVGQKALIKSEYNGFTGEVKGIVEQIGLQIIKKNTQDAATANSPTNDQNTRVVAVKVKIYPPDNSKVAALTNMQVRVNLDLSDRSEQKHLTPKTEPNRLASK